MKLGPHVEDPDLVFQKTGYPQSSTHPWPAECDSRQTIQAEPNHSNRVVPQSRGLHHTICTRVAQLALVLGSSGHVQSDPCVPIC